MPKSQTATEYLIILGVVILLVLVVVSVISSFTISDADYQTNLLFWKSNVPISIAEVATDELGSIVAFKNSGNNLIKLHNLTVNNINHTINKILRPSDVHYEHILGLYDLNREIKYNIISVYYEDVATNSFFNIKDTPLITKSSSSILNSEFSQNLVFSIRGEKFQNSASSQIPINIFNDVMIQDINEHYSSVYFDGDSDYLNSNISFMNSDELTAMVWVNVTKRHTSGFGFDIFTLNHPTCWGTFGVETIGDYDGGLTTKFRYSGCISTNQFASTAGNYPLNEWHHITLRINESHLTFYVNGVQDGSLTKSGPTQYGGNGMLYFGVWSMGISSSHSYGGHLRDFFLFNRSLSNLEINEIMINTNIFN